MITLADEHERVPEQGSATCDPKQTMAPAKGGRFSLRLHSFRNVRIETPGSGALGSFVFFSLVTNSSAPAATAHAT